MKERTILHSDVNNFFASVECATRPDLKAQPVAVTGNPKKRTGIILAKNEIAKKYGVKTGQTIWEAKLSCPDLVTLPPHYDLYEEISEKLHELYLEYTDFVEPLGLDECWLDVTDSLHYLNKDGKMIADELRKKVKAQFGFTVSVGVSFSKIFAKLGSDMKKPDATTIIPNSKFKEMTYNLPLNSIVGIGRRLENRFAKMNINTIGEFVELGDGFLQEVMGITGVRLKNSLLGCQEEQVLNYYKLPAPKSIGNGTTTITDVISREDIKTTIHFLAQKVSSRLIKHQFLAGTIGVSVKTNTLQRYAKAHKISPTQDKNKLAEEALKILDKFWKYDKPVRSVRLRTSNFSPDNARQLSMFENETNLSKSINLINEKYGYIAPASEKSNFINSSKNPHE